MLQEKVFKASRKPFNIDIFFGCAVVAFVSIAVYFRGANASFDIIPEATENDL